MFNFFFLAHGVLGWSDEILLVVVLAAILSYVLGMWYAGRHLAQNDPKNDSRAVKEPAQISLD